MQDFTVVVALPAKQWAATIEQEMLHDLAFLQPIVGSSEQHVVLRLRVRSTDADAAELFVRERLVRYRSRFTDLRIISCAVVDGGSP